MKHGNKDGKGFIYLVQPFQFVFSNLHIYKPGYTEEKDVYTRINTYGEGSQVYTYFCVKNAKYYENIIHQILRKYEKSIDIQQIYGKEYYTIPYQHIIYMMRKIIGDDIIYEMDIEKDNLEKKYHKLFPYFDKDHNTSIYNRIMKKVSTYESTYSNQIEHFYHTYCNHSYKKRDVLIQHVKNTYQHKIENKMYNYIYEYDELDIYINEWFLKNQIVEYDVNSMSTVLNSCVYICHCCLYRTSKRSDMIKHVNKKKSCKLLYIPHKILSLEEFNQLSLKRRFFIMFDYTKLRDKDYAYIINHFCNDANFIKYTDIYKNPPLTNHIVNNFLHIQINIDTFGTFLLTSGESKDDNLSYFSDFSDDNFSYESLSDLSDGNFSDGDTTFCSSFNDKVLKEEQKVEEKPIKKFNCLLCGSVYKKKQTLIQHLKNKKICENRQLYNKMMNENKITS